MMLHWCSGGIGIWVVGEFLNILHLTPEKCF